MGVLTWLEAEAVLEQATCTATTQQLALADVASIAIPYDTPTIVAGAMLRVALFKQLGLSAPGPPHDSSLEWIEKLWPGEGRPPHPANQDEADAWVEHLFLVRRKQSLAVLRPDAGDLLSLPDGVTAELSSIGKNGRLNFKGGRGFSAWPDQVTMVAKQNDDSARAEAARDAARNAAARRLPARVWSSARHRDLAEFEVLDGASTDDVAVLESVIGDADDERSIQKHLESRPQLLTALMRSGHRFVIPQKRLGSEFVPDFLIADTDSLGIHWLLIELESPRAAMYLKDGTTLSAQARKGVDQVIQWRNWLASNVAYARSPRRDQGLGLYDIREKAQAVVLVGTRQTMKQKNDAVRHELRQSSNIEVHTYDWLLEALHRAVRFHGPPALNAHLIRNDA